MYPSHVAHELRLQKNVLIKEMVTVAGHLCSSTCARFGNLSGHKASCHGPLTLCVHSYHSSFFKQAFKILMESVGAVSSKPQW